MRTVVEVSVGVIISGELRQATASVEVPEDTAWEAAAGLAAMFGAAYAQLWDVPPDTMHATVTVVQEERTVVRHGDVRCGGRAVRRAPKLPSIG